MNQRILTGYLPPLAGIPKTSSGYARHKTLINIGDVCYAYPAAMLTSGRAITAWNFAMSADEVNERFSHVVFFIPCRIAEPPYDQDGYPFKVATEFIEKLKIPFCTLSESVQSSSYDYDPDYHTRLSAPVRRYLQVMADRSNVVGTRGEYSAEILNKLGIKNVEVAGCASLFVNGPSLPDSLLRKRNFDELSRIALTYNNYQYRTDSLVGQILRLAAERDYYYVEQSFNFVVKLLCYPETIDAETLDDASRWYGGALSDLMRLFERDRLRYFTSYTLWKQFLGTMDFVTGSRIHGHTPAIHAGVPAFFIVHDSRAREICEYHELPFSPERDVKAQGLNIARLHAETDYAAAHASHPAKYRKFIDLLKKNGITPNCDADYNIADYFEPTPHPDVMQEIEPTEYRRSEAKRRLRDALLARI